MTRTNASTAGQTAGSGEEVQYRLDDGEEGEEPNEPDERIPHEFSALLLAGLVIVVVGHF